MDFCPLPITKRIVSVPGFALAALIASRSVQLAALQTPSSVSAVEFTVYVAARTARADPTRRSRRKARRATTPRV